MHWLYTLYFAALVIILLIKFYIKYTTGKNNSYTCLVGKTAVITGANSGKNQLFYQNVTLFKTHFHLSVKQISFQV